MRITQHNISFEQFNEEFNKAGRGNQFSYVALHVLYDYINETEPEDGYELDVIELCTDYSEYDTLEDVKNDYNDIKTIKDLEEYTTVIPYTYHLDGKETTGYLIQAF